MSSLKVEIIPMVKDTIFGEPFQEKETWGFLSNAWEWSVQNAENCRSWNEVKSSKVDGSVVIFASIPEDDDRYERPAVFKMHEPWKSPKFMAGPVALWEGEIIEARTVEMTVEDLEYLIRDHHENLFLYRAFTRGSNPNLYVRMHIRDQ